MPSLPATQAASRGTYFTKSWFGVKPDPIRVSPSLITQVAQGKYVYVLVLGVQPPILALFCPLIPLLPLIRPYHIAWSPILWDPYPAVLHCQQQGKASTFSLGY